MKILVYGAGVIGSVYAARLQEAGHDVSILARGMRLAALRDNGILLAAADSSHVRHVPVTAIEVPASHYDLTTVFVRTHQLDSVLESMAGVDSDVLFMLNWAAGSKPLEAALGLERVLLGFPVDGGRMDGEIVRYRVPSLLTRLVTMPIGQPDGQITARVHRAVEAFRSAGANARPERQMDAWLTTHAAFEVPLGLAVHAAGGLEALGSDSDAIRRMIAQMRRNLDAMPERPVPRAFNALRVVPPAILIPIFRAFLRSTAASPLATNTPAVTAELERLAEQLLALSDAH
jgi:2-dehydropantoate 2-reductase